MKTALKHAAVFFMAFTLGLILLGAAIPLLDWWVRIVERWIRSL